LLRSPDESRGADKISFVRRSGLERQFPLEADWIGADT
jgi:hypothetical protein